MRWVVRGRRASWVAGARALGVRIGRLHVPGRVGVASDFDDVEEADQTDVARYAQRAERLGGARLTGKRRNDDVNRGLAHHTLSLSLTTVVVVSEPRWRQSGRWRLRACSASRLADRRAPFCDNARRGGRRSVRTFRRAPARPP